MEDTAPVEAEDGCHWWEVLLAVYISFPAMLMSSHVTAHPKNNLYRGALEMVLCVLPVMTALTVLSSHLIFLSLTTTLVAGLVSLTTPMNKVKSASCTKRVCSSSSDSVTMIRAMVGLNTAIAILAVDFKCFPAKFMKTERYGFSVMDVGASGFLLINAIVDMRTPSIKLNKFVQTVVGLLVLGTARLVLLQATDYTQNPSEYGVHSNFFFVLAGTKLVCAPLCQALKKPFWLACAAISLTALQYFNCSLYALWAMPLEEDGTVVDRSTLILANRETIVAMPGHFALYCWGALVGKLVFVGSKSKENSSKQRSICRDPSTLTVWSCICAVFCLMVLAGGHLLGMLPSRRVMSPQFIIWMMFVMLCCVAVSGSIEVFMKQRSLPLPIIVRAVNAHQLLFFLLANVSTGVVNLSLDTKAVAAPWDTIVVLLYTAYLCATVTALYSYN